MDRKTISDRPKMLRIAGPRGIALDQVDREAGIIRGFSTISYGEAQGHGLWIDDTFLDQATEAGRAAGRRGLKSRFTHPGLSSDGMGTQVGRSKNYRREGNQVFADLHLYRKSNQEYVTAVLNLAEEDPAAFGASIVYSPDGAAEESFVTEHKSKDGVFKSPDRKNRNDYPHARLAALHAVDMVDDPAANPTGLFSIPRGSEIPAQFDAILSFALGLTDAEPLALAGFPHPERARRFIADFLTRNGLKLTKDIPAELPEAITELARVNMLIASNTQRLDALEQGLRRLNIKSLVGRY